MSAASIAILASVIGLTATLLGALLGAFVAHQLGKEDELAKEQRVRQQRWEDDAVRRLGEIESHLASIEAVMHAFDLIPKRTRAT